MGRNQEESKSFFEMNDGASFFPQAPVRPTPFSGLDTSTGIFEEEEEDAFLNQGKFSANEDEMDTGYGTRIIPSVIDPSKDNNVLVIRGRDVLDDDAVQSSSFLDSGIWRRQDGDDPAPKLRKEAPRPTHKPHPVKPLVSPFLSMNENDLPASLVSLDPRIECALKELSLVTKNQSESKRDRPGGNLNSTRFVENELRELEKEVFTPNKALSYLKPADLAYMKKRATVNALNYKRQERRYDQTLQPKPSIPANSHNLIDGHKRAKKAVDKEYLQSREKDKPDLFQLLDMDKILGTAKSPYPTFESEKTPDYKAKVLNEIILPPPDYYKLYADKHTESPADVLLSIETRMSYY